MFDKYFKQLSLLILSLVFSLVIVTAPATATTMLFKTEGIEWRDGKLTGVLMFEQSALDKAVRSTKEEPGVTQFIPLSEIDGAKFSFKYVSPYSGVEHTQTNLCDVSESSLSAEKEPMLVLSPRGLPTFIDFGSCVGNEDPISSKISRRDPKVALSIVESQSGRLKVSDKDEMGKVLFQKTQPIELTRL